jgi:hypothetical protein
LGQRPGGGVIPYTDTIVEIYLCDPRGVRIDFLDYCMEYEYMLGVNEPTPFRIRLPAGFDRSMVQLDDIIEIWRGHGPGTMKLDYCGFLRDWEYSDDAGIEFTELRGWSSMYLLAGRICAVTSIYQLTPLTDQADDMIKAIAHDQIGADAGTGRNLTSVGGGFTIQSDNADGVSLTKQPAWSNLLTVCQEIADASNQGGTAVYFDVVPVVSSTVTGALAFDLRTWTGQRGNNRAWNSSQPAFIGSDWGNLENGSLRKDCTDEKNYVFVLGQGDGAGREYVEVQGAVNTYSIWNRREGACNGGNADSGDTAALTAEGNAYLRQNKVKITFTGDIIETPYFRYGRDWNFGDSVAITYGGWQFDGKVNKVVIGRGQDGQEVIKSRLEVTS